MARLLWLPEVLANAGLTVHLYDGWKTRGADSFGPVKGIVCHGTAGSLTSTDAGELRVLAITGSSSAPAVPISQLYLSRSGDWWVVASGTATGVKTGTGGPLIGLGDDAVLQIEAQHSTTEPWTDVQYQSYVRGVAALVAHRATDYAVTVDRVVGHGEHQPGEKTDPWFNMTNFRRRVAAILLGESMTALEDWAKNTHAGVFYGGPSCGRATPDGKNSLIAKLDHVWGLLDQLIARDPADVDEEALADALAPLLEAGATPAEVAAAVRAEIDKTKLGPA